MNDPGTQFQKAAPMALLPTSGGPLPYYVASSPPPGYVKPYPSNNFVNAAQHLDGDKISLRAQRALYGVIARIPKSRTIHTLLALVQVYLGCQLSALVSCLPALSECMGLSLDGGLAFILTQHPGLDQVAALARVLAQVLM